MLFTAPIDAPMHLARVPPTTEWLIDDQTADEMDSSDTLGWTRSLTTMKRMKMKIYHGQMRRLLMLKMAKRVC